MSSVLVCCVYTKKSYYVKPAQLKSANKQKNSLENNQIKIVIYVIYELGSLVVVVVVVVAVVLDSVELFCKNIRKIEYKIERLERK